MQVNTKVNELPLEHKPTRYWIGLFILLMFFIVSFSLGSCASAPAAVAEPPAAVVEEAPAVLPAEISVDEAYQKYQEGTFLLDVRTPEEWDEFHAPDTTLIPLDELEFRLDEIPEGEEIVVICRSGNRSQVGRDILLANGFDQATSVAGGLNAWRAAGYPVE